MVARRKVQSRSDTKSYEWSWSKLVLVVLVHQKVYIIVSEYQICLERHELTQEDREDLEDLQDWKLVSIRSLKYPRTFQLTQLVLLVLAGQGRQEGQEGQADCKFLSKRTLNFIKQLQLTQGVQVLVELVLELEAAELSHTWRPLAPATKRRPGLPCHIQRIGSAPVGSCYQQKRVPPCHYYTSHRDHQRPSTGSPVVSLRHIALR